MSRIKHVETPAGMVIETFQREIEPALDEAILNLTPLAPYAFRMVALRPALDPERDWLTPCNN